MCELVGVNDPAMSKYLNSNQSFRIDIIVKIAQVLDINIYQLLGLNERKGTTFNICKTALLARRGAPLTDEQKNELINLILDHK